MSQRPVTEDSPGSELFPEYAALYDFIAREAEGLSDAQLDFTSDRWEWSGWSIRTQLSHMASLIYRWLLIRWGDTLFPEEDHGVQDIEGLAASAFERRMDEDRYGDFAVIMRKLRQGIDLAWRVLHERNVRFLRSYTYLQDQTPQWRLMARAHPTGFAPAEQPGKATITLEATMRHIYFEETTHLYNIQRLKKAQGLTAVVDVPRVGYWVVDGWDISEPD